MSKICRIIKADSVARNWTNELLLQDKYIDRVLSIYADIGVRDNYMSEVVAEAFSVRKTNPYAMELIARLKGLIKDDASTDKTHD